MREKMRRKTSRGMRPGSVLPIQMELRPEVQRRLDRLEKFEAPFLENKLLQEGFFSSKQEYRQSFVEFKRFIALSVLHGKPMGMISPRVDEIWHTFILYTRNYAQFCEDILGFYLHHTPCGPGDEVNEEALARDCEVYRSSYQEAYGKIPAFIQACCSGNCDSGGGT